jgi:hypothetical protein
MREGYANGSPSFILMPTVRIFIVVQHIFFYGYITFYKQRLYAITLLTFDPSILQISNRWVGSCK